ncbi:inositol monophosphatase family protein [Cellulomonas sp. PhB143]|uniref:inositol monophosphatase family protein n=1 Tax=Cellulomonas sp. PhB143 TaxID=2485186 RepID=UPI003519EFEB
MSLRSEHETSDLDVRVLKDAGDRAAQTWLALALASSRPSDAVLSEEAADDPARLGADRVWIIDPLDGTREFAERNADGSWRDDFAVHVALWQRGRGLGDGAVALPARGIAQSTASTHRVTQCGSAEVLDDVRPLRVAASRSRPPAFVGALAERDDVVLVPMGSAGVKVLSVVDGTTDVYIHGGGQYEWDSAAPVAVARAAGLVCTRLDGSALEYNRESPWLPDLFVCDPFLADRVRDLLASVGVVDRGGSHS